MTQSNPALIDASKAKPVREPVSKKMRFDVFKRDCFKCQYCGNTPPQVVLEVDHINPVKAGGRSQINNLLTACFDCNRGKGAGLLSSIPATLAAQAEIIAEKLAQVKAFERMVRASRKHEESQIDEVEEAFRVHFPELQFTPKFRESVRSFLQKLPVHELVGWMHRACTRVHGHDAATKYFCGICWNQIKAPR